MTWTIRSDDDITLTPSALQHDSAPCIAYTFTEADRWADHTTLYGNTSLSCPWHPGDPAQRQDVPVCSALTHSHARLSQERCAGSRQGSRLGREAWPCLCAAQSWAGSGDSSRPHCAAVRGACCLENTRGALLQQAGWCCRPATCGTNSSNRCLYSSDRCWEAAVRGGDCWCSARARSRQHQP